MKISNASLWLYFFGLFAFLYHTSGCFLEESVSHSSYPNCTGYEISADKNWKYTFSVEKGIMAFENEKDFYQTLTELEKNNFKDLRTIERQFKFVSLKTIIDETFKDIHLGLTVKNAYLDYYYFDTTTFTYTIDFPFYMLSALLNKDGLVKIKDQIFKFSRNQVCQILDGTIASLKNLANYSEDNHPYNIHISKVVQHSFIHSDMSPVKKMPYPAHGHESKLQLFQTTWTTTVGNSVQDHHLLWATVQNYLNSDDNYSNYYNSTATLNGKLELAIFKDGSMDVVVLDTIHFSSTLLGAIHGFTVYSTQHQPPKRIKNDVLFNLQPGSYLIGTGRFYYPDLDEPMYFVESELFLEKSEL